MTQPSEHDVIWLTPEAYDKLKAELAALRGPVRDEIIARIASSREEGDLRENGGYHAAREEQAKAESRVRQLEDMLRRARVGETPPDDGIVEPGMVVTIRFGDEPGTETFLLGAREIQGASSDLQVYSPQSPLGSTIAGAKKGDTVPFVTPNGKELKVHILDAVPYSA